MNIYWFAFRIHPYNSHSNVAHQRHQAEIQLQHRDFEVRAHISRQRYLRRQLGSMHVYYLSGAKSGGVDTELQGSQTRLCKNRAGFMIVSPAEYLLRLVLEA